MNTRTAACTALLALAALTGCSSSAPAADPAACKAALEKHLETLQNGEEVHPDECAGISDSDVRAYGWAIVGRHATDGLNDSLDRWQSSVDDYVDNLPTDAP